MSVTPVALIVESNIALQALWRRQLDFLGMAVHFVNKTEAIEDSSLLPQADWVVLDDIKFFPWVPQLLMSYPRLRVIMMSWDKELGEFLPNFQRLTFCPKSSLKDCRALAQTFSLPLHASP